MWWKHQRLLLHKITIWHHTLTLKNNAYTELIVQSFKCVHFLAEYSIHFNFNVKTVWYVVFPTCVSLRVATEGPLRCPMTPVFSPVSMSGSSPFLRYYTLHVVVVCPSFVSVATPRPAVAQRRGRAFHGTAVIDSLRDEQRDHQGG